MAPQARQDLAQRCQAVRLWQPRVLALLDWDQGGAEASAQRAGPGPLAGWSVAVKDIIDLAGKPTRCNADFVPAQAAAANAAIVDALLAQGAYVLAKSVTTTFAYIDPGPTRNPWNPRHTPGGSSSGSAAAVACGMARLALGTQTVGSINRPASFCGVVGFKPTYRRLPTAGVFPLAPSVDTVGFFTADVADARAAFSALCGGQAATPPPVLRVAVCEDLGCEGPEPAMARAVAGAADALARAGHHVRPLDLPDAFAQAAEHHWRLVAAEAVASHQVLFERWGHAYTPRLRALIERGRGVSDAQIRAIHAHRELLRAAFAGRMEGVDLLLSAAAPGAAPRGLASTGDPRMNLPWSYLGCPSLTIPAALDDGGLPLGIQLVALPLHDEALLAAAAVVEGELRFNHRPPVPT